MFKKFKFFLAIMLALFLIVGIAACGDKDEKKTDGNGDKDSGGNAVKQVYVSDIIPDKAADGFSGWDTQSGIYPASDAYFIQKDINIDWEKEDRSLTIRGKTYEKGIGTHTSVDGSGAFSDIHINIADLGYTKFESYVGIDDQGNVGQDYDESNLENFKVIFEVHVDGALKATSGPVSMADDPFLLTADVTGGGKLTLRIYPDIGSNPHTGGTWADWCDAILK